MSAFSGCQKATREPFRSVASSPCAVRSPRRSLSAFSALLFVALLHLTCQSAKSSPGFPRPALQTASCGHLRPFDGPPLSTQPLVRVHLPVVSAGSGCSVQLLTSHGDRPWRQQLALSFQNSWLFAEAKCPVEYMPCKTWRLQPPGPYLFIRCSYSGRHASRDQLGYSGLESRLRQFSSGRLLTPWARRFSVQDKRTRGRTRSRRQALTDSQRMSSSSLHDYPPCAPLPTGCLAGCSTGVLSSLASSPDRTAGSAFLPAFGGAGPASGFCYSTLFGSRSSTSNPKQVAQQGAQKSGKQGTSTFSASGKIVSALPGGYFMVELTAVTSQPRSHGASSAGPYSPPPIVTPPALVGKQMLCSLGGKLRLNRIRVQLFDVVDVEFCPLDPTRGRIVYRRKPTAQDTSSSHPS
ncbi:conserved hypothetical protein [Neospora caninum Liverpool]|uniref:S1-like domain-containing protein n=1 Tax=Neospora caninum (strain Liverpool) TaxID=572307 RepID=F0VQ17_NEOCL|nr:conserved hypothetical protein [Neospora caninum Liverpool]CBZ55814.1 conserved hypothetical protein [Neospora caninum Liverpool]CEL70556.1 TPA: hypothetical protein BN1204_062400 [Neospora caninum Liverpool]|eukprot:XP_003885840.1 conserved hypothetical protein [Neospora caninum Liverpool]